MNPWREYKKKTQKRKAKRRAKRKELTKDMPYLVWGRKQLRVKLDNLWSFLIRLRDRIKHGPMCRICGNREGSVAYHIVPKQRGDAVRWRLDNGVLACSACNYAEQMNRSLYRDKHVKLFGKSHVEKIEAAARKGQQFTTAELAFMADDFRTQIENIRGGEA